MASRRRLLAPLERLRVRTDPEERRIEEKHAAELAFWEKSWERHGGRPANRRYRRLMLAMAGEQDDWFLKGKIVADFGCGPRGSLAWAQAARLRIGIDVLTDAYAQFDIRSHDMCYVWATEDRIPLASGYVDVMFTLNALDHVAHLEVICADLLRTLAPGGELIGSFNLDEPPARCEPQTLTEQSLQECLLRDLEILSYRQAAWGPEDDPYAHFFDGSPPATHGRRLLWVRARKPGG